jgi:cytochrome P450
MRDHSPILDMGAMQGPMGGVLVSKHDDVLTVLRNPEVFSSRDDAIDIGQVRPLIPLSRARGTSDTPGAFSRVK